MSQALWFVFSAPSQMWRQGRLSFRLFFILLWLLLSAVCSMFGFYWSALILGFVLTYLIFLWPVFYQAIVLPTLLGQRD